MILPQTHAAVLFLMILSLFCWGSWANSYKLAGKWRYELYYFDFALGMTIAAFLYAFTVGNLGFDGFSFIDDLMHAGKRQWLYGFMGGVIFNLGNMILMSAISVAGMAVAFPVGVGVAIIVGTILAYAVRSAENPGLLLAGCVLIAAAIVAAASAYRYYAVLRHEALARAGKAASTRRPSSIKGIVLALVSGLLMGSFVPLVDNARASDIGLGPYAVTAVFSIGVFVSTFVFNVFLMNLPVEGEPLEVLDIFKSTPKQHLLGLAGGALWCTGMVASLAAESAAAETHVGAVAAYFLAQGFALIAALWGILLWKEFKGADLRVKTLAIFMFLLFAGGLLVISQASLYVRAA
ncbi:MAG: AcrB/AcrD/AcrF family protein [Bryobacteraceae bacterium]|jgi:glucose uptake protein